MGDFLDDFISEKEVQNPDFPKMVDTALRRRDLMRKMAKLREAKGLSQTKLAAAIGSSQSSLARIEQSDGNVQLTTLDRIAEALGYQIKVDFVPLQSAATGPPQETTENKSMALQALEHALGADPIPMSAWTQSKRLISLEDEKKAGRVGVITTEHPLRHPSPATVEGFSVQSQGIFE